MSQINLLCIVFVYITRLREIDVQTFVHKEIDMQQLYVVSPHLVHSAWITIARQ